MAGHTSEKRWEKNNIGDRGISSLVKESAMNVQSALGLAEETYQELLELWQFAGGTDQLVADQLFAVAIANRSETTANAVEVAMVADAKAAMLAAHEVYGALTNVVTIQADRVAPLRRMS